MFNLWRNGLRAGFVLITAVLVSASAQAATIDFRAADWRDANGEMSYTVEGVRATGGQAALSYDAKDGLGVKNAGPASLSSLSFDDELVPNLFLESGPMAALTIKFNSARLVQSFTWFQDVHREKGDQIGHYSIDGGEWLPLTVANNGNGVSTLALGWVASQIAFAVNPEFEQGYWLRAMDVADVASDVPEPTSLILLGAGLMIGAARLRRRK